MPPVDLVDDVQVTRQKVFKQVDWPAFQGLRQYGVVGVGTGTDHNVPGLSTERTGSERGVEMTLNNRSNAAVLKATPDYFEDLKGCLQPWVVSKLAFFE